MTTPAYTLPTIHLNGTSAKSLSNEYYKVYVNLDTAIDFLVDATCNARDFYPQGEAAWQQAKKEREEALDKLREVQQYVGAWILQARLNGGDD